MMTLILFLIIGVAAFNLISMLVMTVNEKIYCGNIENYGCF